MKINRGEVFGPLFLKITVLTVTWCITIGLFSMGLWFLAIPLMILALFANYLKLTRLIFRTDKRRRSIQG